MKIIYIFFYAILAAPLMYSQSVVPLSIGNKWIFNTVEIKNDIDTNNYLSTYEIIKDTIIHTDIYGYVVCYKVAVINSLNPVRHYEYWGSDSLKFIIYISSWAVRPPGTDGIKYDSTVKKDTSWGVRYVKLYEIDFLNIHNRNAQEWCEYFASYHYFGNSYYTTALDFGIVDIITDEWVAPLPEVKKYSTIKGAIIDGIIYGDTVITSIKWQKKPYESYDLFQNFPNPFNPATKISYQIPKAGNVKLIVFDCLGNEIETLVNTFQTQGYYSIDFNASRLSSGIYFYQLKTTNFIATKKMIVIK
jgi:hypothetical protein